MTGSIGKWLDRLEMESAAQALSLAAELIMTPEQVKEYQNDILAVLGKKAGRRFLAVTTVEELDACFDTLSEEQQGTMAVLVRKWLNTRGLPPVGPVG